MQSSFLTECNWLQPLTEEEYYKSFCSHLVGKGYAIESGIFGDSDFLVFSDTADEPAIFIFPKNAFNYLSNFNKALDTVMKGLTHLKTQADINVQCASVENVFNDTWPHTKTKSETVSEISDMILQREPVTEIKALKRKRELINHEETSTRVIKKTFFHHIQEDDNLEMKAETRALLSKLVTSKILRDRLIIYGLTQMLWRDSMPYTIIPIHSSNKLHMLEKILSLTLMRHVLIPPGKAFFDTDIIGIFLELLDNENSSIPHVLTIEAQFDESNKVVNDVENSHLVHSSIFTLYDDTIQSKSNNESDRGIVPMYIKCNQRPLNGNGDSILILRSLLLYILSFFPDNLPNLQVLHGNLDEAKLLSLIETDFVIEVLSILLTHKSRNISTSQIFNYFLLSVQCLCGTSNALSSISPVDISVILTGQKDVLKLEYHFDNIEDKHLIKTFLQKNMTPLDHILVVDKENGKLRPQIIYQKGSLELYLGIIPSIDESSDHHIVCREAQLGQSINTLNNFGLDKNVIKNINLTTDNQLIFALIIEGTNSISTFRNLVDQLCFDKYTSKILQEYEELVLKDNHYQFGKELIIFEDDQIRLTDINFLHFKDQFVLQALDLLIEVKNSSVKAKYMIDRNKQYVLWFHDRFITFPNHEREILDIINKDALLFRNDIETDVCLAIKWICNHHSFSELQSIACQLNPTITNLLRSAVEFFNNTNHIIFTEILEVIHHVLTNLPSRPSLTHDSSLQSVVNKSILDVNSFEQIVEFCAKKTCSQIFKIQQNNGYLFYYDKSDYWYFLDDKTLLPFGNQLGALNIVETWYQMSHNKACEEFDKYNNILKQLYWKNITKNHQELLEKIVQSSLFYCEPLLSFCPKSMNILEYGSNHTCNILTELILTTPLGSKGKIFEITSNYMEKLKYFKVSLGDEAIFYVTKENKPVLLIINGTDVNMVDILLLQYITTQDILMGFSYLKLKTDDTFKMVMITDNSEKSNELFSLQTVNDVFKFLQTKYGDYKYICNIKDIDSEMYTKSSFHKDTSVLTYLNLWRHKWDNVVNYDYRMLPSLVRYAYHIFPHKSSLKPYFSLNSTSPKSDLLQEDMYINFPLKTIYINHSCISLIFENTHDVLKVFDLIK